MGFHRGVYGIKQDGLIFAFDDQSKICLDPGDLTKFHNLVDPGDEWTLSNGTIDGEGYLYYSGTGTWAAGRSYLDQSDLTKNLNTASNLEEYTLEAWFRYEGTPGTTTNGMQIFGTNSGLGVGIQLNGHNVNFGYRSNSNFDNNTTLTPDTWYHVLGTRRGPSPMFTSIYLNGVDDGNNSPGSDTTHDIDPDTSPMQSGRTADRIIGWYKGNIPIMRLYNTAMTATEVLANYNAQKKRFGH